MKKYLSCVYIVLGPWEMLIESHLILLINILFDNKTFYYFNKIII